MLDVIYGQTTKHPQVQQLIDALKDNATGDLYIGYPVISTADETLEVDALLVSKDNGLVAFLLDHQCPPKTDDEAWKKKEDEQDKLYFALKNNLSRHEGLRVGRNLAVEIHTVTVFPTACSTPDELEGTYCGLDQLPDVIRTFPQIDDRLFEPLQAALQRVTTIKPRKRRLNAKTKDSRGTILKQIEQEIANLDQWQKRAAIECPEGPQRIRGLAGSGKTIVLALKAAYLHAQHPEWRIVVTFHTRSLYQQFQDLIRRFTFEHLNDEPDWENLRIMHSWGGVDRDGVYTEIAAHAGQVQRDFLYGKSTFGMEDAFKGVCAELLQGVRDNEVEPLYDAILIDEAQDLPPEFFQLVYKFTKRPKRIVWAYDELQKLSESTMPSTAELFGVDDRGEPIVRLVNTEGQPRQDIVLPVCYRNTPWALTLAHALGLGIYRKEGLIQHFNDPRLWEEIGYQVESGALASGEEVSLVRKPKSYPSYFPQLLNKEDAVLAEIFETETDQAEWIAKSVQKNLEKDELDQDDILIILPDAYTAKKKAIAIEEALRKKGINSHLAGVTTSRDKLFLKNSVAIANIYRSKGNEAPMVYVAHCQDCASGYQLVKLRNILFTAITRCKAWVRLTGYGDGMILLMKEINAVRENDYRLKFKIPTPEELKKIRKIHRDRSAEEMQRIKKAEQGFRKFLETIRRGDLPPENLPPDIKTAIAELLRYVGGLEDDAE